MWNCLTDVDSWISWWDGNKLMAVDPGWEKGGTLVWSPGSPSDILECRPRSVLEFGNLNMGMEIRRYFKISEQGPSTALVYGVSVAGGSMAPEAEAKEKSDMALVLKRLGRTVAAHRDKYRTLAAAAPAPEKQWWKFWR